MSKNCSTVVVSFNSFTAMKVWTPSSVQWHEMKLTSMYGEFWSLFMSEVARLNKKANIYILYCYEVFGLQASAVQTPFDADFQSHNSSLIVKAFCSRAALANSLIYFSSVEFTPGSFYRNRCLRLGVLNNNSNCFKRAYQIWLIMTAYSCKIFFFYCYYLESPPRATECSLLWLQAEKSVTTGGEPVMWTAAERRHRRCERKDFLFRTMTCFCRPLSSR